MRHGVFQLLITTQFIAVQEMSRNKLRKKITNKTKPSIHEKSKTKIQISNFVGECMSEEKNRKEQTNKNKKRGPLQS
jgi:hypothetical protein